MTRDVAPMRKVEEPLPELTPARLAALRKIHRYSRTSLQLLDEIERLRDQLGSLEHAVDQVDVLLDGAGVQQKGDDGRFLGIVARTRLLVRKECV
jgi:hypothetical protein